jgi:N-dimethylarginine dimethylaminohydrolase
MCPPTYFDIREVKNPHMQGSHIDRHKAEQQWLAVGDAFRAAGLTVHTVDPVPGLEDMVFAANQVFVGSHPKLGRFIVPSEMRHPSRQKEVPFYVQWFRSRGYGVIALDLSGECLEGHGDLIWHPGRAKIWAGYGFRSTVNALKMLSDAMRELGFAVIPLGLADEHFYHLDTCFNPLNSEAVLVYPAAFSADALEILHSSWSRIHELTRDEALAFLANGAVVNGRYIVSHPTANLERILGQEGLMPVRVDTSEFEKSGGSVFCLKTFLD